MGKEGKAAAEPAKRVSARSMESAMAARLLLDLLRGDGKVARKVAAATESRGEVAADWPRAHPSFERRENAVARLSGYVDRLLAGEAAAADPNPILRIMRHDGIAMDFSLESFSKAALGDDGILALPCGVSEAPAGSRSRLALTDMARLALYSEGGEPLRRSMAIIPVKEILEARRRVLIQEEAREAAKGEGRAAGEPEGNSAPPEAGASPSPSPSLRPRDGEPEGAAQAPMPEPAKAQGEPAPSEPASAKGATESAAGAAEIDEARFRLPPELAPELLGALSDMGIFSASLEWAPASGSWKVSVEGERLAARLGPALARLAVEGVSVALRRKPSGG